MACDHLLLIDDRSSAISLPEVPLLGVLPGTGGLTRLTDKRHVRRDHADVFATKSEGVQGAEALAWHLVDELAAPSVFDEAVRVRALALADTSNRDHSQPAAPLSQLKRAVTDDGLAYQYVSAALDRPVRTVTITVRSSAEPDWPLTTARELDDLICHLRFNEPLLGTCVLKTAGSAQDVLAHDRALAEPETHIERETSLLWKRALSRLDLTARSLIAVIDPGSCFAGVLAELALAADRSYMLDGIFEENADPLPAATLHLSAVSQGCMSMLNELSRLESRFWGRPEDLSHAATGVGRDLLAAEAFSLGLVTSIPDDLDWDDEVRLAIEERASFSPDALTAMEANHRFAGPETMATKIFARLSAWQNWVFIRPNASGPTGALRRYGSGTRPDYDHTRT